MKKLIFIFALVTMILLPACGGNPRDSEAITQAKEIIKDVPLPTLQYSPRTGHALNRDIEFGIVGYETSTGNPIVRITINYEDSSFWSRLIDMFSYPYHIYGWEIEKNHYAHYYQCALPNGYSYYGGGIVRTDNAWVRDHTYYSDVYDFTIDQLKEYHNKLIWKFPSNSITTGLELDSKQ